MFHPCSIRGSPENLVGNESVVLISGTNSTDIYLRNASTGYRVDGTPVLASLSPGLGSDGRLGRNDGSSVLILFALLAKIAKMSGSDWSLVIRPEEGAVW